MMSKARKQVEKDISKKVKTDPKLTSKYITFKNKNEIWYS